MNRYRWAQLDAGQRQAALARPPGSQSEDLRAGVASIIQRVRNGGQDTLLALTAELDGVALETTRVPVEALENAWHQAQPEVRDAIDAAMVRIEAFHKACMQPDQRVEVSPGVVCERVARPVQSVGLYVPAGSAPLPSTTLMLGVPARLAECPNVVLCSPPNRAGQVDSTVLAAAWRAGIREVHALGGAQAIAAMAFGAGGVRKCDKLYGPGNAWVTEAKLQVSRDPLGAAIDLPAGPSEVMVVADASASPQFVAADLLSQAEHGADSQVVLVALGECVIAPVQDCVKAQLADLSRGQLAGQALAHARLIEVDSRDQALEVINAYAPEHLVLQLDDARGLLPDIQAAGSIFVGALTPESLGDYCSGTNHVLPTYGYARSYSGVSVDSFQTRMTVQEVTAEGLRDIGPTAVTLAGVEGLTAHARAVTLRLEALDS